MFKTDGDRKQTIITMAALLLVVLIVALFTFLSQRNEQIAQFEESTAFQSLAVGEGEDPYTDLRGQPVELINEPQTLVVYSWASWCPACQADLVELDELAGTLGGEVKVLAVNRQERDTRAQSFLSTIPELQHLEVILDPADKFFNTVGGYAMPEVLVFDQSGNVVRHDRGALRVNEIRETVQALETDN
jgi:thiol-disulfide isomerase/thioredoxin